MTLKNANINLFILILLSIGCFFLPFIFSLIGFLLCFFCSNKVYRPICFGFLIFFIALLSQILILSGDIVSYYDSYLQVEDYSFNYMFYEGLATQKIFRYMLFYFIHIMNGSVKLYPFISILITSTSVYLFLTKLYEFIGITNSLKSRFILLLSFFSIFQFSYLFSFENILGFSLFALGQIYFIQKEKLKGITLIFVSFCAHQSLLLFIIIFIFVVLTNWRNAKNYFYVSIFSLFIFISSFNILEHTPYLAPYIHQLKIYATGNWSHYVGTLDYLILFITLIKLGLATFSLILLRNLKLNYLIKFIYFMLPIFILFLTMRTLGMRYSYSGFFLANYLFILILFRLHLHKLYKDIIFLVLIIMVFFPVNILYMKNISDEINIKYLNSNIISVFQSIPTYKLNAKDRDTNGNYRGK